MRLRALVMVVGILAGGVGGRAAMISNAWEQGPEACVVRFARGGERAAFLAELKAVMGAGTAGEYQKEYEGLIVAMGREPQPPARAGQGAAGESEDEAIRRWIYEMRDSERVVYFSPFSPPMKQLVRAGPAAMDALLETLDDDSPSRQLGDEEGPTPLALLRRSDMAMMCIEAIADKKFFRRTQGRGGQFHNDPGRASAAAHARAWWAAAKGKSEAEGIRIQLRLWKTNTTLAECEGMEGALLVELAQLEPTAEVLERLRALSGGEEDRLGIDLHFTVRQALGRLALEKDAAERLRILKTLALPHFFDAPALAAVFEKDEAVEVRAAAGELLLELFRRDGNRIAPRGEMRKAILASVRRVADGDPPAELLLTMCRLFIVNDDAEDYPRVKAMAAREPVRSDESVSKWVEYRPQVFWW